MFTANFLHILSSLSSLDEVVQLKTIKAGKALKFFFIFIYLFFFFCSGSWGKEKAKPETKLWQNFLHFKCLLFVLEITFFNVKALSLNF